MVSQRTGYIEVGAEKLHCISIGTGPKVLVCFHGYRNNATLFTPFAAYLEKAYTIVSVDLPHHGKSNWTDHSHMHPRDLVMLIDEIRSRYSVDKVSLLGYSLGGRVCLKAVELMPERIDKVLLIASDGLVFNPFYYFVTRTGVGRHIFSSFLTNPNRFVGVIEWAKRRNLIDASRYRFFMQYLDSDQERMLLLRIWPSMSRLIPNTKKLKDAIHKFEIPVSIYMGKHDRIIPVGLAQQFTKDMKTVKLFILDRGHRVFDAETIPKMAECLLS
ncbi:MAG: alpha/beta hydrolase [Sphingobacteriales bacterium]|nr:MAG: alpha/beta hydrolase [Sphingobacteriales bacterium]